MPPPNQQTCYRIPTIISEPYLYQNRLELSPNQPLKTISNTARNVIPYPSPSSMGRFGFDLDLLLRSESPIFFIYRGLALEGPLPHTLFLYYYSVSHSTLTPFFPPSTATFLSTTVFRPKIFAPPPPSTVSHRFIVSDHFPGDISIII
ncbi:unnamed protein product [Lactuca virosa]|uniref:Uncharacterized protein n=1 Tax=Lactuca virosa TaxID=75947 RepID=A0AAU9P5I4_9ASTR|nr:unnamed protein product [Lactuca virosa]